MKIIDFNYDVEKYAKLFYDNLSGKDKRLFAALEAMRIGYYGVSEVSTKFQLHKHTIRRGLKELVSGIQAPQEKIRHTAGNRKRIKPTINLPEHIQN